MSLTRSRYIVPLRLRSIFRREPVEQELDEELRFHIDQRTAEKLSAGMTPEAASRAARVAFGNRPLIRELAQDTWGWRWLDELRLDIQTALRMFRRNPAFSVTAVLTLALGMGAATAIFSVVDAVVLRALPFDAHERLVAVGTRSVTRPSARLTRFTPQDFLDWRERQQVFDGLAAFVITSLTILEPGRPPEELGAMRVSSEFFDVLRTQPLLGRTFSPEEETEGRHRRAVISYGWWHGRFGGTPDIIGRMIPLAGGYYEVVGVMRPGVSHPFDAETPTHLWVPLAIPEEERVRHPNRFNHYLQAIGRLRNAVSLDRASAQLGQIALALEAEYPTWNKDRRIGVRPLYEHLIGERTRSWMWLLLGAVTVVLLIAYANVANLMLARTSVRQRDIGIRTAIGAGRGRIVRQLLVESVLLSVMGTVLGLAFAWWGVELLRGTMPDGVPRVASIALDLRVLGVAATGALGAGLAFGLFPALHGSRPGLTNALTDGARGATSGRAAQRLRSTLVVAEIALAVILLVGAGLFIGSFVKLMRVELGLDPTDVLTAHVALPYDPSTVERDGRALLEIIDQVERVPDVQYAAAVFGTSPAMSGIGASKITVPGRTLDDGDIMWASIVTPDYHRALRIPLHRGRYFEDTDDRQGAELVVLLGAAAATQYFPGDDPVGKIVEVDGRTSRIVGVVGDVRIFREGLIQPIVYIPLAQRSMPGGHLVVRTAGDPLAVLPAVRAAVYAVLPDVPVRDADTLEAIMRRQTAQRRLSMLLLGLFGVLGLVIAAVGVYGVLAYVVTQRTREIGVRVALGATRAGVAGLLLHRAATLSVLGLVIGAGGAWILSSVVRAFLFELEPTDARVFAAALAVLAVSALAAAAIPARRAAAVDPIVALRVE